MNAPDDIAAYRWIGSRMAGAIHFGRPWSYMLIAWLTIDLLLFFYLSLSHRYNDIAPANRIQPMLLMLLVTQAQFTTAIAWVICGQGRLLHRWILPVGLLAGLSAEQQLLSFALQLEHWLPSAHIAWGLHAVLASLLFYIFRRDRGLRLATREVLPEEPKLAKRQWSLQDLFMLTTFVAVLLSSAMAWAQRQSMPSGFEGALSSMMLTLTATWLVLNGALSASRPAGYVLWIGVPLLVINLVGFFAALAAQGVRYYLYDFVALNLTLLAYPLSLVASIEILHWIGYEFRVNPAPMLSKSEASTLS